MINKGKAFGLVMLAPILALVPVSAIAGEGPGEIVVQGQYWAASALAGAQIYECVENEGKFVCKFRELTLQIDDGGSAAGDDPLRRMSGMPA